MCKHRNVFYLRAHLISSYGIGYSLHDMGCCLFTKRKPFWQFLFSHNYFFSLPAHSFFHGTLEELFEIEANSSEIWFQY